MNDSWTEMLKQSKALTNKISETVIAFYKQKLSEGFEKKTVVAALYSELPYLLSYFKEIEEYENWSNSVPTWYRKWKEKNSFSPIPCQDHTRFTKEGYCVLEPYDRGMKEFKRLVTLCEANGWTFIVSGNSVHYPAHTFRIKIIPELLQDALFQKYELERQAAAKGLGNT